MNQRILRLLSIAFFSFWAINLSAQKMYFGVQTGYGFATSAGQANLVNSETSPESGTYEIMKGGYGEGINTGVFIGRFLTRNIGIELAANYLFGKHLTTKSTYWAYLYSSETTVSGSIKMLQLTPQLVFRARPSKITPYAKVGLTLGLGTTLTEDILKYVAADPGPYEIESTQKSTGNIPVGFSSTLGATYEIGAMMDLFVEFRLLTMAYSPSKTSVTAHNNLDNLTISQKETIYLDKIEYDDVAGPDDKPSETLRISLPLSAVSFNLGLKILL
jgi:hypothetical protein